jgi:hypothetical protein
MTKKWSILILTQPSRVRFLDRLLGVLKPQIEGHHDIELVIRSSDPDPLLPYGENCQQMREAAHGEYVNFVDDDDLVSRNYVGRILPLLDGVDYIGFKCAWTCDGRPHQPWFHSLKFPGVRGDASGVYRDISHFNPIRRELALHARMSGGSGADGRWAEAMRALGIVKTEHVIDEVMYYYFQISDYRKKEYYASGVPPEVPF